MSRDTFLDTLYGVIYITSIGMLYNQYKILLLWGLAKLCVMIHTYTHAHFLKTLGSKTPQSILYLQACKQVASA